MTWQGVPVTGPLLIFHSEIQQTVSSNSLTCIHPTGPVAWYLAVRNTRLTTESSGAFINVIINGGRRAQIMRGTCDGGDETSFDGLWTCRLNGAPGAGAFHVGIYDDTPTTSRITHVVTVIKWLNINVWLYSLMMIQSTRFKIHYSSKLYKFCGY